MAIERHSSRTLSHSVTHFSSSFVLKYARKLHMARHLFVVLLNMTGALLSISQCLFWQEMLVLHRDVGVALMMVYGSSADRCPSTLFSCKQCQNSRLTQSRFPLCTR